MILPSAGPPPGGRRKGLGIVGTAAAVADAIHHATGRRVRSLPITVYKLLAPPIGT